MSEDKANDIAGFEETDPGRLLGTPWQPVSDRRVRVGIAGYGVCRFGAHFGFQNHPNVEVVAVTDAIPENCVEMAAAIGCEATYPTFEEMVKDERIEAVFVATDARSHARHSMLALEHGKHVASAVPAVYGSLEDAQALYDAVRKSGLKYMMFETSAYHDDLYLMREACRAGLLGRLIYSEGHYYHYFPEPLASYRDWRAGIPPMWYPTHSTAYYVAVTGGRFTAVSCLGFQGDLPQFQADANVYGNPFDSETALLRTDQGGSSRMNVCWGTPGSHGEYGAVHGEHGTVIGTEFSPRDRIEDPDLFAKPQLPPGMDPGGHGGSHGYLTNEFITAILEDRDPMINVAWSLNMTVAGIVAHQSALRDGEWMQIPPFRWP